MARFEQYNRSAADLVVRADAVIAIVETDIKGVSRIALSSGFSYEVVGTVNQIIEHLAKFANPE